jgi:hypothetical protein
MIVAGGALAVVVGAVLAYLWSAPGLGAELHLTGLVVMVVGLLALASVLVAAIIGLRRTGKHRRSGLVAAAAHSAHSAHSGPEAAAPAFFGPEPAGLAPAWAAHPAQPVRAPQNPPPAGRRDQGSGRRRTDNFGAGSGYEGSHASRTYGEPAARRDTPAGW